MSRSDHRSPRRSRISCRMAFVEVFDQHDDPEAPGADPGEEALDAPTRGHQASHDVRGPCRPPEHDHVIAKRDGRDPRLQVLDLRVQPLRHDRDQQAKEQDVAEDRDDGRDGAQRHALVIPEIARVAQAKERPPDGFGWGDVGNQPDSQKAAARDTRTMMAAASASR